MAAMTISLPIDPGANELLNRSALALLIGMVLDQQIPLERAFRSPYDLQERLGRRLDAAELAEMDPDELARVFSQPPALHRFPAANAKRVQELCRLLIADHGGKAANVWKKAADGPDLLRRVKALPGFGEQKARIFVALLGKQLGVTPDGWQEAAGPFGEPGSYRSVADIRDAESLARVRAYKQEMKAKAKAGPGAPAAAKAGRTGGAGGGRRAGRTGG
jgi:uncharacterized HhH-GPD family protein